MFYITYRVKETGKILNAGAANEDLLEYWLTNRFNSERWELLSVKEIRD